MDPYIRDCDYLPYDTHEIFNAVELNNLLESRKNTTPNLKIFQQNIRSLARNRDQLEVYLSQFDFTFDCIILTETWKIHDLSLYNREGYDVFYNEGDLNKADGVIAYVRKSLYSKYSLVNIGECKAIQLEINLTGINLFITAIYRSPSICVNNFIEQFHSYLDNFRADATSYHIIAGDINIDILGDSEMKFNYLNTLSEHNYHSFINRATRPTGSCIDHIFVNGGLTDVRDNCQSYILRSHITDHHSTSIFLSMPFEVPSELRHSQYNKYIKYAQLRKLLKAHDWGNFYSICDVEEATNYFVNTLQNMINICTVKVKVCKQNEKRKCWITFGLIKAIKKRDQLYKLWQSNPEDNVLKNNFTAYRNMLNSLIRQAKVSYYRNLIADTKGDSKKLWNIINKKLIFKVKQSTNIEKIIHNNTEISDRKLISNAFNEYFSHVGEKLATDISPPTEFNPPRHIVPHSIFLHPTTVHEVGEIIQSLKNTKAPGFDNIRAELLKQIKDDVAPLISNLINKIMDTGECPRHFKVAIVRPLHKSGSKNDVNNYRPISLISNLSKVFEKVIKVRLTAFLERYNIISDKQYGFREGRNTQDAIAFLTSNIYAAIDEGRPALCVFLDLTKAFDTLSHKQLLDSLQDVGIRGKANKLMSSYLSEREQFVMVESTVSTGSVVKFGVPQGTVLGPLLFLVYINSLLSLKLSSTLLSFADDTVLFYSGPTWETVREIVERDMRTVADCLASMQLTLNLKKTVCMPFTAYADKLPIFDAIYFNGMGRIRQRVGLVERVSYLGVVFDRHLRWDLHIQGVVRNLQQVLYKFKMLAKILMLPQLRCLYYSLIESRLSYGILGWGGLASAHLKQLEVLQRRCLKIMLKKDRLFSSDLLYKEANVLDIRQLYFLQLVCYHHRNRGHLPTVAHSYSTRAKERSEAKTLFSAKRAGQRCHVFLSPKAYNFLRDDMRGIYSLKLFKCKVKKFVLTTNRDEIYGLLCICVT